MLISTTAQLKCPFTKKIIYLRNEWSYGFRTNIILFCSLFCIVQERLHQFSTNDFLIRSPTTTIGPQVLRPCDQQCPINSITWLNRPIETVPIQLQWQPRSRDQREARRKIFRRESRPDSDRTRDTSRTKSFARDVRPGTSSGYPTSSNRRSPHVSRINDGMGGAETRFR